MEKLDIVAPKALLADVSSGLTIQNLLVGIAHLVELATVVVKRQEQLLNGEKGETIMKVFCSEQSQN